jgi:hypothetical protein
VIGQRGSQFASPSNFFILRGLQDQAGGVCLMAAFQKHAAINQRRPAFASALQNGGIDCAQVHRNKPAAQQHQTREGDAQSGPQPTVPVSIHAVIIDCIARKPT